MFRHFRLIHRLSFISDFTHQHHGRIVGAENSDDMDFAKSFLANFGVQVPANLKIPVQVTTEDRDRVVPEERRGLGCRRGDEDLQTSVLDQVFSDIDWSCNRCCSFGRRCSQKEGFLPFVCNLRETFWGKRGSQPPTSSERSANAEKLMRDFHVKAPNGESTFNYSYGATCEDGRTRVIPICEHIYFTALGGGKTSMWYKVQEKIAKPEISAIKGNDKAERDRASFKSARVKAFISRFLSGCEMPPFRNMEIMYILPFRGC